jgi:hypothetical protein
MLHSEYIDHLKKQFNDRADDQEFQKMLTSHEKTVRIMINLNFDPVIELLKSLYAPFVRHKPRDPVSMLRSLALMILLRFSSIDKWVEETRYVPLYAILAGFEPGDLPGVGTYYDYQKRIIDGPFQKTGKNTVKRSQFNSRRHIRHLNSEKKAKKDDVDPNHSQSEILMKNLLDKSDEPRPEGFEKILEDLLFKAGIIPSIESGVIDQLDKLIISGDGSILETASSKDGKRTCTCREEGIFKCDHPRSYTSRTAEFCWNHHLSRFVFGDRYYHLILTQNGHDFPLITIMPGGNESDYTLSLKAVDRFIKAAGENGVHMSIDGFCGDGHHDAYAHYHYFLEKEIRPFIPLSKNSRPVSFQLPDRKDVCLDEDGIPLCPQGVRMRRHQYDKKRKKHVFCCPAKRPTHKDGKPAYVFREALCPNKRNCEPKSSLGPFVYIRSESDPRLYPPVPRDSKLFKDIMNQRSASERINFINDSYNIEKSCRNADYGLIRLIIANIVHHAVIRYSEAVQKSNDNPLSELFSVQPELEYTDSS